MTSSVILKHITGREMYDSMMLLPPKDIAFD